VAGVISITARRRTGGVLPLPLWERVGVRGYGLSVDYPSPGGFAADLSRKGRGEERDRREFTPSHYSPLTQ
jgi:hypothetical protein